MMKKLLCTAFAVILMLSLVSCDHGYGSDDPLTEKISDQETEQQGNSGTGEMPLITIESWKEYQALLKAGVVSDKFVDYESISMFGEFCGLVFLSDVAGKGDYSIYLYDLKLSTNDMSLYIYENGKNKLISMAPITDVSVNDLRNLEDDIRGAYTINGFEYRYVAGKLHSISWTDDNGIEYIFASSDYALSEYELRENDVISALLTSQYDDLAEIAIFKDAVT